MLKSFLIAALLQSCFSKAVFGKRKRKLKGKKEDMAFELELEDFDDVAVWPAAIETAARRRAVSPPENARPTKQRRRSENSKLDNGQGAWTKDWNSRIETSLLRTDQFHKNNEMLPSGFDPYSVAECMDKLESIPDVENVSYFRAMERFLIPEWRQMFIKMSEARRRKWLESLKN
ncbi:hypothetical protein TIFTF001_032413 [Ficus carica]|uniref:Uncharacterized protein n=1 Tax=Ficus carica TaxID=3494 RepID=A0AA88DX16_FICCA|nr:hypothetical protein TIFTF001_032413 [Ficus carica]